MYNFTYEVFYASCTIKLIQAKFIIIIIIIIIISIKDWTL